MLNRLLVPCAALLATATASEDAFRRCLVATPQGSLGYCLGVGAVEKLRGMDADPEFDVVDGVTFCKDEEEFREGTGFVDASPGDFRAILQSMGHVFSRRSLRWDMSFLYPGLHMRVAPSGLPGGTLDFVLDPQAEALNQHSLKEASTGQLVARQFLVPFLLGFKFNLATAIPIIFGLLAIIAKKAVVLSKLALVVSSALGLGSLLFAGGGGHRYPPPIHTTGLHGNYQLHPGLGSHSTGGLHYHTRFPEEDLFRASDNTIAYPQDDLKLYEGPKVKELLERKQTNEGRNFAWSEAEKKEKT